MEYQVLDWLSFQRFLGLRHCSQVPDRTTFWTVHERLTVAKAGDVLFETVSRQLAQHGYITRGGRMVDARLAPVPRPHNTEQERELLKAQAMPANWKPAQCRRKDDEGHRDEEAWPIVFRLQGIGQHRPTQQVDPPDQGPVSPANAAGKDIPTDTTS